MSDKYPKPREAVIRFDVRHLDRVLNLPPGLRVKAIRAKEFPPGVDVLIEGDALPERHHDTEPHFVETVGYLTEDGDFSIAWDESRVNGYPVVP